MEDLVAPAMTAVNDAFERVVAGDGPEGVSFTVRRHGEVLFSRVAGRRNDEGDPLANDTLMPVFSGTKGLVAGTIAVLVDKGLVRYDAPVAEYWQPAERWPELTVAMALSHRACMPQVDGITVDADLYDTEAMLALLAKTNPMLPIGTRMAYHYITYGWFAHVIIKGATGLGAGDALRRYVTEPFGIDAMLAVPESELPRCGMVMKAADYRTNVFHKPGNPFTDRVYASSPLTRAELPWNQRANMVRELAGGSARSTADAMAKFYDTMLATDAPNPMLSAAGLHAAWSPRFEDIDFATDRPIVMAMGFERDDSIRSYGSVAPAFGHTGAGGSIHGCWPEQGISFSFLPRTMRTDQQDQRGKSLLDATAQALIG